MAEPSADDIQRIDDVEKVTMQETPPTPPSPEDLESADSKASRKREREVSIEPATPKADEQASEEQKERRRPATKKNRVILGTTAEEDETPPSSPQKQALELATSPPHETKVRQISMKVRGLKWDDKAAPDPSQDTLMASVAPESPVEPESKPDVDLEAAALIGDEPLDTQPLQQATDAGDTSELKVDVLEADKDAASSQTTTTLTRTTTMESDSDDQEKRLKRKLGDRIPSSSTPAPQDGTEPSKRARDDAEEDTNPREKKRPSPPPEESNTADKEDKPTVGPEAEPVAPQPKPSGFAAYAATSSPFASAKGPSVFGTKSTPSPSPLAGTSNGAVSSLSSSLTNKPPPSPFAVAGVSKPNTSVFGSSTISATALSTSPKDVSSPTGTKRTGFEAFASSSSPFTSAARSKSPTGFNRSNASAGLSLARSKSPSRRTPGASSNAFKSYVGSGTQSFASPFQPAKKPRQDSSEESDSAAGTTGSANQLNAESSRTSPEGSEEEAEQQQQQPASFADRLRAEKNDEEAESVEEKPTITEQEVQTGEEEDKTLFQVRGKLYVLSEKVWKERGTGQLKLNVRRSDGRAARLLMRKEAVFTLLLNVPLFKGMHCTLAQDPRYLRFSCLESSGFTHYNLRLANAKVAGELLEEIRANIPGDADDAV